MRTAQTQFRSAFHSSSRVATRILSPPPQARNDARAWRTAIEPFLPVHLRADSSTSPDLSSFVTAADLTSFLNRTQDASLDILGHLGLVEGRWQTTVWLAKKLAEDGRRSIEPLVPLDPFENVLCPEFGRQSLDALTERPFRAERVSSSRSLDVSLDGLTSAPDSINVPHVETKRAIGQLWQSLGNMILVAVEEGGNESKSIMSHVLEIIAHLHHIGFIPDAVYTYRPPENNHALGQPPTLHMLSSKILTALSDATWKAHEASVRSAKAGAKASYHLGHEIPGSRYKIHISEVVPELWLELVLWSCLHGGWVLDGYAILKEVARKSGEQSWALVSWREIMQAAEEKESTPDRFWKLFSVREKTTPSPEERAQMRRTISGELVAAFVDGLISQMRLGVGSRGTGPEYLLDAIKTLKAFLDTHNLSLGSTAWDSIMNRLLDSGGFMPEKRPESLLRIFDLATGFATEISAANASVAGRVEVAYFFEPTTVSLSLLHCAIRVFIKNEDLRNAISALMLLQMHTDNNKQTSMQQFFDTFRNFTPQNDEPFTSRLPPVDFPAFDPKIPVVLLAQLLDLATKVKMYDFGRWLLFSNELDGPLIDPKLYLHRKIATSIVRFGTLAGEHELVLRVVKELGTWNSKHQQHRMPAELFTALFCCQLKLQRWASVRGMQQYVEATKTFKPRSVILSTFAAELLRTSKAPKEVKIKAKETFTELLFAWESLILSNIRNELYCILSIISTVDPEWREFCSPFLAVSLRQTIELSTEDFNQVLDGVLDGYGSLKAMEVVDKWCHKPPKPFEAYHAPGGLSTMSQFRVDKSKEYIQRPPNIELVQESGTKLVLHGRVYPNRQTIWSIVRRVQEEVALASEEQLSEGYTCRSTHNTEMGGAFPVLFRTRPWGDHSRHG